MFENFPVRKRVKKRKSRQRRAVSLISKTRQLERLEARRLLAVSVADLTVNEGDGTADIVITNSPPNPNPVSFDAATAGNSATGGRDYRIRIAPLTIPANQSTAIFTVDILEDTQIEGDEQFFVNVSNVSGGETIADGRGVVTIIDNDSAGLTVSVADVTVNENAGTADVSISVSENPTSVVTVVASTTGGSAADGADFLGIPPTTIQFLPGGPTTQTVSVDLINDTDQESDEQFFVNLSAPVGAIISDGLGVVTITDDDGGGGIPGEFVGIDFTPIGSASPTNWNAFSDASDFSANDLIDETGASTNIDLNVAFGEDAGFPVTFADPANLPTHSNSLAGLDGGIADQTDLTFTFSDLTPGNDYEIYVFGGDPTSPPFSQEITITGDTTTTFTQAWDGTIFVNDLPTSSAPLESFAITIAADTTGQIIVNASETAPGDFAVMSGLAIRELQSPPPVPELVGVDFGLVGMSSPLNWTPGTNGTDFTLTNLLDETGSLTNFDLAIVFDGGAGPGAGVFDRPDPAILPTHTNPLTGVGGVVVDEVQLTFVYSDLTPGAQYDVWVFGGGPEGSASHDVTIAGDNTVGPFSQSWNVGEIFVNQSVTSTAQLDTFAERITANSLGQIVITVSEDDPVRPVVIDALAIREVPALVVNEELIGVDFGPVETSTPANWTLGTSGTDFTLTNLIDETNNPTEVDLSVEFDGGAGLGPGVFNRPDPNVLPTHTNPLTGIGGVLVDDVELTFTYSDLTPGAEYDVWVFGGDPNNTLSHNVTIAGANTVGPFSQSWTVSEIFVNQSVTNAAPLDSFAEQITANATGQIVITVTEATPAQPVVIDGLAIRRVPEVVNNAVVSIGNLVVDEESGVALLTATLSEPRPDIVQATIATSGVTATSGIDFLPAFQTLNFTPGQTESVFAIPIIDDTEVELAEDFTVDILSVEGAGIGASAVVTIVGNEFRTIDGTLNQPDDKGAAETRVIRFGYPHGYVDLIGDEIDELKTDAVTPNPSFALPNPRDVSNAIMAQDESVPNARSLSDWIVQWGQFITHDMDLTGNDAANNALSTGGVGDFNIPVLDPNDPLGPGPIPFNRSNFDPTTGNATPRENGEDNSREQINDITSFIDASNVYGSDDVRARELRTFIGGRLRTSPGDLPDFNTAGLPNDNESPLPDDQLFLAGDVRANEQIGLTATHTLFVREHNRLADMIAVGNPGFDDEEIYQWARRIVGAQMQIITYEEFLPALLGAEAPDPFAVEDRDVDPSITNSFANAFFRYGHSMQSPEIQLVDNDNQSLGSLSLRDAFFQPGLLVNDPSLIDHTVKGLASQEAQENDILLVDDIRNFLFGPPGAGGLDLGALDLQRGRDHGLLGFNEFRLNYGLPRVTSFAELTSDPELQAQLQVLYGDINHVEAFVGGLAENHVPGTSVGSMLVASLNDQFSRLRDGDQFFYTVDPTLQHPVITSVIDLDNFSLSDLIRDNTAVTNIQDNVFFVPASVSGITWSDSDGNGAFDSGETVLPGVTVFVDGNTNGSLDPGERSVVSDSDGFYQIDGLDEGTHVISELVPSQFDATFPSPVPSYAIPLAPGEVLTGLDFGNQVQPGISSDFGDAPLPYSVSIAENGAQHPFVIGSPFLGNSLVATVDGTHSDDADADNSEDGVTFGLLHPGTTDNQVQVQVMSAPGALDAWIDFNQDGDWNDPGEQIFVNLVLPVGTHDLTYSVPAAAIVGDTFARFRISSGGNPGPDGISIDGEVEDYKVSVAPLPSLSVSDVSGAEGAAPFLEFEFTLSQPTDRPVTFDINTIDGSALDSLDYFGVAGLPFLIPAGNTTGIFPVAINEDGLFEASEIFELQVSNLVNAQTLDDSGTGTITNDDPMPNVSVSLDENTIDEASGTVTGTISLDVMSGLDVTATLGFHGLATNGTDYSGAPSTITIPAGLTETSFVLTAEEDSLNEFDENIDVSILTASDAVIDTAIASVTIIDNDALPSVNISLDQTTIDEEGDVATATIVLSEESGRDINLIVGFNNGTATEPLDFTVSSTGFVIPAGQTESTITITSATDSLDEDDETILIELVAADFATIDTPSDATVTITDNDSAPNISLAVDVTEITEGGGLATGVVSIDAPSGKEITFSLDLSGTADSGIDYVATPTSFTFSPGTTSAQFTVNASADLVDENDETVSISLNSVVGADDSLLQPQTVTILDANDPPNVSLSFDTLSISESGGLATGTVTISEESGLDVTVDLAATGTASGSDFSLSSSTVTIPAGTTTATFTVNATDNSLDGVDTTVIIDIENPVNATEATEQQETIEIADDDPSPNVTLAIDESSIDENGTATGTVTIDAVSSLEVTVDLELTGTALNPGDYTITSTSVTIAAGQTEANFTINSVDDSDDEADETIIVDVTAATNGSEVGEQQVSISIIDNDQLTPVIASTAGDPTNLSVIPVTVMFPSPVTGFDASDLQVVGGTAVNFTGGNSLFGFDVMPTTDGVVTIDIATGAALDAGGQDTLVAEQFSLFSDQSSPIPVVTAASPTGLNTFAVSIDFGEPVSDFVLDEIAVVGGTVTDLSDDGGGAFTATVDASGDGTVSVGVAADVATDAAGNANAAAVTVDVIVDTTAPAPVISGPASTVTTDSFDAMIDFGEPVIGFELADISLSSGTVSAFVDDGDGLFTATISGSSDGSVTISVSADVADDTAGNGNLEGTQSVLVDTTAPELSIPTSISVEADSTGGSTDQTSLIAAFLADASATDAIDSQPSVTNDSPADFPLGETVVTFTATDDAGNSSTATASVTVVDSTAPTITAPGDISVEGDTTGGTTDANASIVAFLAAATSSDVVDETITISHDAPALFGVGETLVTFTATDDSGNENSATATVTVSDSTSPNIVAPADLSIEADSTGGTADTNEDIAAFLSAASGSDVVDDSVTITHDAPAFLPLGDIVVTFTATDDTGNSNSASATITVVDTTDPTVTPPANVVVEGDETGGAGAAGTTIANFLASATASDVVDDSVTITHDAPSFLPLGDTVVTFTATDDTGNSNSASATVTVVDTTDPAVTAPADVVVEGDETGGTGAAGTTIASLLASATASDVVDDSVTITHDAPAFLPLGDTVVIFTATDDEGNVATASTTISVSDTTAPTIAVPADVAVRANVAGGAEASLAELTSFLGEANSTDVVDDAVEITHDAPSLFPVGDTTVTFTATDDSGNSATGSAIVTVLQVSDPIVNVSPAGPGGEPDPVDLPGGTQPTSWSIQRSGLREIVIDFDVQIALPTANDLVLTNLGMDADNDPDSIIALRDDQLSLSADGQTLTISLDAGQLSDGVYQLDIMPAVTGGEMFSFIGDEDNEFFVLSGDWNGSGAVNIQDFATFAYWFAESSAPGYVDLNNSGLVNIQDFAGFARNFGKRIVYPSRLFSNDDGGEGEATDTRNQVVSIEDAVAVIDSLHEEPESSELSNLDLNGDGMVKASDALFVINRVETEQAIAAIVNEKSDEESEEAIDALLSDALSLAGLF